MVTKNDIGGVCGGRGIDQCIRVKELNLIKIQKDGMTLFTETMPPKLFPFVWGTSGRKGDVTSELPDNINIHFHEGHHNI